MSGNPVKVEFSLCTFLLLGISLFWNIKVIISPRRVHRSLHVIELTVDVLQDLRVGLVFGGMAA